MGDEKDNESREKADEDKSGQISTSSHIEFRTGTSSEARANSASSSGSSSTIRSSLGRASTSLSDFVNGHLREVRFVSTASIGLLAAYGLASTPLFFRYRTAAELPGSFIRQRKTLTGRLVKVWVDKSGSAKNKLIQQSRSDTSSDVTSRSLSTFRDRDASPLSVSKFMMEESEREVKEKEHTPSHILTTHPIQCRIRHSSPMESLLSKSWYDWFMRLHPKASTLGIRPDELDEELLLVEIAGVRSVSVHTTKQKSQQQSSFSTSSLLAAMDPEMMTHGESKKNTNEYSSPKSRQSELEWLEILAEDRPLVSFQLLGRRVPAVSDRATNPSNKRRIPGLADEIQQQKDGDDDTKLGTPDSRQHPQIAIARLYFRSPSSSSWDNLKQTLFPTDLALSMIRMGRAVVLDAEEGLVSCPSKSHYRLADTTDSVRDLRRDVAYVETLHKAQYQAVAEQRGMWQDPIIRDLKADVVTEVEFQTTSPWWKKAWRWMRGG